MSYFFKSIGLIILAFILYQVDLYEVWEQLRISDPILIAAAIILIIPQVSLRAYRWQQMLALGGVTCPFRLVLSIYFAGIYVGLMTPGRLGEVAKALFLKKRNLASISQTLPSIIADRCLDLYLLCLVAAISVYYMKIGVNLPFFGILIIIAIGGIPWIFLYLWSSERLLRWIGQRVAGKWGEQWGGSIDSFNGVAKKLISARMTYMLALTVFSYGVYFFQTWLIACSVGLELNYSAVAMVVSIAILIGYVPVTVAGLGTREAVLICLFEKLSLSAPLALSFAFIYNLVYIFCMGGVSALFWFAIPQPRISMIKPESGKTV